MRDVLLAAAVLLTSATAFSQSPPSAPPAPVAAASDRSSTDEVQVRLISTHRTVQPGQKLLVALEQRIAPHWHTYWRNPGDSGQPTSIEWKLPAGAKAGEIQWPAPKRFDVGPITNYGYEDTVLLLTDIELPSTWPAGQPMRLTAEANWLVCKEECIPQQATLTLDLPTGATPQISPEDARLTQARASLPTAAPFPVEAAVQGQTLRLRWSATSGAQSTAAQPTASPNNANTAKSASPDPAPNALFLPQDWGRIQHAAKPTLQREGDAWLFTVPLGEQPPKPNQPLPGLLQINGQTWHIQPTVTGSATGTATTASIPSAAPRSAATTPPSAPTPTPDEAPLTLWMALALALAGGIVLNLMPCVFPVLAIKALGFLHGQPGEHRRHGLAYTAGVLSAFAGLAAVLIAVRAAGGSVGWGFQFHSPLFVLLLAWLMFVLGLSLAGLVQIGAGWTGVGQGLASRPGLSGSFFTGVLATIVATPCTAPFMGAALAYALAQPPVALLAVFLALGLGLALPYLALACWPALQRRMPRPGAWMDVLKQALAFPMFGAAIWLTWVIAQQAGPQGVLLTLVGMGLIALAAWARSVSRHAGTRGRWTGAATAAASVAAALALLPLLPTQDDASVTTASAAASTTGAPFEPYSPERLSALRAEGKPVFVNLTAAWCITCLVNERVALSTPQVRDAFQQAGITYLKGDWTRQDPRITELLKRHGRSGVPLYLFYPPGTGDAAQVLPQILTPGLVTSAVQAGAT